MKVLHVIDSLGRGGAEQLLAVLMPELRRQGVDVAVAVRGGAMDLAPILQAEGIEVIALAARHRWNLIGMARELARLARARKADILHAHLYFPAVAVALVGWLRLAPVRTCVTFHNLAYAGANRPTAALAFRRRLAGFLYRRGMDRCLAVSAAVATHYRQALGLRRVDVLPNPVDVAALAALAAGGPVSGAVGADCRIVMPGRIVPEKGHADLIAAMALLAGRGGVPHLVIAGDGPGRADVAARIAAAGLKGRVEMTGALAHGALMAVVAGADIVVIPSRHEGFGLTALEAMALGRAVVASRAGGLPETVGTAGVLVPVADPAALAEAIRALAQDPAARARLGAEAAARAGLFDLGAIAGRLIGVYEDLTAPGAATLAEAR